ERPGQPRPVLRQTPRPDPQRGLGNPNRTGRQTRTAASAVDRLGVPPQTQYLLGNPSLGHELMLRQARAERCGIGTIRASATKAPAAAQAVCVEWPGVVAWPM